MTRLHYISPSLLPSRSANSVHVMHQCDGFARVGINVSLYAKRTIVHDNHLTAALLESYGVNVENWDLRTFYDNFLHADTLRIALMALMPVLRAPRSELVLSRNLYAAWILANARKQMLFETHQLEYGARKAMQLWIMTRPWVRTVVISNSLVTCLEEHHEFRLRDPLVLHDAAPDSIQKLAPQQRRQELASILALPVSELTAWNAICGYFGQLYHGRGIEIIEAMASKRPSSLFLVFGGDETDVSTKRMSAPANLRFMGHVSHPIARRLQAAVDILLMPYQRSVSIGIIGHDTARWMSPMKMFEYLGAGVPIISSDLPVLREVLIDGENCLLARPSEIDSWLAALDRIAGNPELAARIGSNAHDQYERQHTWTRRAEKIIEAACKL